MSRLLEHCHAMLRINSTNPQGNSELARWIGERFKKRGFQLDYQAYRLAGAKQLNFIARAGPKRGPVFLLNTHLDTVTTDATQWTQTAGDPFNPTIKRGRLYGLGAADTKLALACQWEALSSCDLTQLKHPLWITGTYGEEMGLLGVKDLIRDNHLKPRWVLNSEPTELRPCAGNFGFRVYELKEQSSDRQRASGYCHHLRFKGQAAHSAMPNKGKHAIIFAQQWLKQYPELLIIEIVGGVAPNIVPARCDVKVLSPSKVVTGYKKYQGSTLDCKKVSGVSYSADFQRRFRNFPAWWFQTQSVQQTHIMAQFSLQSGKYHAVFSQRFAKGVDPEQLYQKLQQVLWPSEQLILKHHNPAFRQNGKRAFVKQVQASLRGLKRNHRIFSRPGCNEAAYWSELGGDVLTVGPGEAYGNIHAPNESVAIRELKLATQFYQEMIIKVCG